MKRRLMIFWNTLRALWRMVSPAGRVVIIALALFFLALPIFSQDRALWLLICGLLALVGAGSGYVIYVLLLKGKP